MKHTKFHILISSALISVGMHVGSTTLAQEYYLSTPMNGFMSMSAQDLNGPPGMYDPRGSSGAAGGIEFYFGTLTEHVYVDQVAHTVRQVGTVTGSPAEQHIVINESQNGVSGSITVNIAPAGGSSVSFDTGAQPMTGSSGSYSFGGSIINLGTFVGSWSLNTGGQLYSGSFTYNSTAFAGLAASTFTHFNQMGPNAIAMSGLTDFNMGIQGATRYGASPSTVADVTASDGFHMILSPGAGGGFNVSGDVINWSDPGNVVATLVPEPGSLALAGAGLCGVWLGRRAHLRRKF
jgi:hypothetical protein